MPVCKVCGVEGPTVEFRRSTKKDGSYLCKDKSKCVGNAKPSKTELAWAAGFFDGEGSSYVYNIEGKKKYPYCSIGQNELDPLQRFVRVVGGGVIHPGQGPKKRNNVVRYGGKSAEQVMNLLVPFLSKPKLLQWEAVLNECKDE